MMKSILAVLLAGLLAGCVYETNEAYAPPADPGTGDPGAGRAPVRLHAAAPGPAPAPDRVRREDLANLSPASGTPGPDADARRPMRATPSPAHLRANTGPLFVQAASFVTRRQAERARRSVARLGPSTIYTAYVDGQLRCRIRLGPFATRARGDEVRAALIRRGYPDAIVVRD